MRNPAELRRLTPFLSICITGPQEMAVLYGDISLDEAAKNMLSAGVQLIAVKMGEKGGRVFNQKETVSYPSFRVHAIDTTGAGDSFTAGLIVGWMRKLSLSASAILASALGALAATSTVLALNCPINSDCWNFKKRKRACRRIQRDGMEK
jgi:ribokinase